MEEVKGHQIAKEKRPDERSRPHGSPIYHAALPDRLFGLNFNPSQTSA
jgi:hypothetical protein